MRDFVTAHDYANVGDLLPGHTYVFSVQTPGGVPASVTVRTAKPESIGQRIARYALEFVGHARYEYGGTGPGAFDCSGLAQYVYHHFGRVIPRTAQEQSQYFRAESDGQAHPGDLVFFGSPAYHVGIFEGGGMMVSAATPLEGIRYQEIYDSSATFGTIDH